MIKIVIALALVLPLVVPDSSPPSSPYNRYCPAVGSQETVKSIGEIFEDDSNIVFSSPLSKNLQYPFETTTVATILCCFDSKSHSSLNKKVLALFKLKGAFLI